jgi:hypothetical protein
MVKIKKIEGQRELRNGRNNVSETPRSMNG